MVEESLIFSDNLTTDLLFMSKYSKHCSRLSDYVKIWFHQDDPCPFGFTFAAEILILVRHIQLNVNIRMRLNICEKFLFSRRINYD